MPELSIVTVNYNGLQDTCDLIESLHRHLPAEKYEVIVVDNGSRENEAVLIQERYPFVRVIRSEKNLGFAGGNNLGITQAVGSYIFLLNNDTYITDARLFQLCDTLKSHPEIAAVSPKIRFAFPPRHIQFAGFTPFSKYTLRNRSIGIGEPDQGQYDIPQPTPFLHGAALLIKAEVIAKTGLMPEIYFLYYEEMEWCHRITRAGYQLWYDPQCTIYHKESSTTGQESTLKTYYLTRNRLLYAYRNEKGFCRFITLLYQLTIANPKNILINLLKRKYAHAYAILKGETDFFLLKNKQS